MIKVVQFEVYVREKGRWAFHARYPGYEWDQALEDARRTEVRTGIPTKIVKDTYDPEVGQSQESIAYLSPNAKKNNAAQVRNSQNQTGNVKAAQGQSGLPPHGARPVSDATFFFRLIVSLGASVIIAGALTILLNAILNALPKLGYQVTSAFGSQILMYWYVVMLMLSAIALNRAYVPWGRMLAGRQTQELVSDSQSSKTKLSKPAPGFTGLKPKNQSSEQEAEREKDIQDMKVLRGDLDTSDMTQVALEPPAPPSPIQQSDYVPDALPAQVPAPKPGPATDMGAPLPTENKEALKPSELDGNSFGTESTGKNPSAEDTPSPPPPLMDMDMDGLMMVRFIGDVVMSVRSGQDQPDGTTRFGMSLYLAGAAATLADQRGLTPRREKEILADALERIGHSSAIRDSFLARYDEHLNAKRNQSLIQAGEQDMLEHLRSPEGPAQELGGLIEQWEQPDLPPQPSIGGAFLLTYTDIPQSAQPEAIMIAMDLHNRAVRQVLESCNGTEVRHTGKGIFAHFDYADDAIAAAIAIQKSYQSSRTSSEPLPPSRLALVASIAHGSDSDISGEVFRNADLLCRRLQNGQIACDVLLRNMSTSSDITFGRDIPRAHSGIAAETKAQEILWQALAGTP